MSIFKAYDIRGIYGTEITEEKAYTIGRAIGTFVKGKTAIIGHDARIGSPSLAKKLIAGLIDQGYTVTFTGLTTTPMLHYLSHDFTLGIIVTASHNPKEYNGFKIFGNHGDPINIDNGIQDIELLFNNNTFPQTKPGTLITKDIRQKYIDFLTSTSPRDYSGLRIVIDIGNGATGFPAQAICKALHIDAQIINEQPDGNFPVHGPNPLKEESHRATRDAVLLRKADLGVIFDGDGDRTIFVDERGQTINQECIKILVAEHYLKKEPGAHFVFDLVTSRSVKDYIEKRGGHVTWSRVGYTFLYHALLEKHAIFGGEVSAHAFFREIDYNDSGIFFMLTILAIMKEKKQKISALASACPLYPRTGEINYTVKDKDKLLDAIKKEFAHDQISYLDGISVDLGESWFTIRPSNTEPLIRMFIEGKTPSAVAVLKSRLESLIKAQTI